MAQREPRGGPHGSTGWPHEAPLSCVHLRLPAAHRLRVFLTGRLMEGLR